MGDAAHEGGQAPKDEGQERHDAWSKIFGSGQSPKGPANEKGGPTPKKRRAGRGCTQPPLQGQGYLKDMFSKGASSKSENVAEGEPEAKRLKNEKEEADKKKAQEEADKKKAQEEAEKKKAAEEAANERASNDLATEVPAVQAVVPYARRDLDSLFRIICGKCGQYIETFKALPPKQTKKGQGAWKCSKCNVKAVQLNRLFGGWPPREFKELPEEAQQEFWASYTKDQAAVEALVINTLVKQRIEFSKREYAGSFQPLGYYKQLGYDIKAIEQDTPDKDKDEHPILGMTYKVSIRHEAVGEIENTIREKVLQWKKDKNLEVAKERHGEALNDDQQEKEKTENKEKNENKEKRRKKEKKDKKG